MAQAAEKLAAGEAYVDSGYVVVDELGEPVHAEWYSDEFERLSKRAGVRRIVLHESRHTALSLIEKAGVHASDDDLQTGTDALGKLYKIKK